MSIGTYLLAVAIGVDQLANTLTGGAADETLSARAHRLHVNRHRSWPRNCINTLFFWQADHCLQAYESERDRKQLPTHYQR